MTLQLIWNWTQELQVFFLTDTVFNEKFSHCTLETSNTKLVFFDDSTSEPMGKFKASIEYNNKIIETEFIVLKSVSKARPLFGRDLMKAFNITWSQIHFIESDYENIKYKDLLDEYSELFNSGLGEYKNYEVSLELNEDVKQFPLYKRQRWKVN